MPDVHEPLGESSQEDPEAQAALRVAMRHGMPPRSAGLYARWWQLETWLRELVYVELRAKYGTEWEAIVSRATGRQAQDAQFTHMEAADSGNPLAYLDYSQLLEVISEHWDLFGYALLERRSWEGRQEDLKRVRHRIGHMRVPHPDDLGRLEQTLRDLERGAFIAMASYNSRMRPEDGPDPVRDGWLAGHHDDAQRLLRHAEQQYETQLKLRTSWRPWASRQAVNDPASGVLWHADFMMRDRTVDAATLWNDSALAPVRPLLVHLIADYPQMVSFTFSGADDGTRVADAIGAAFDALLMVSQYDPRSDIDLDAWGRRARNADFRVIHGMGWNIVDDSTVPISIFGAGGGVTQLPAW